MLVKDVMTKKVIALAPDMPIEDVLALMEQRNIRHFPVVDQEVLVGIVSDRDIRLVGSAHPKTPPGIKLADDLKHLMVSPVLTAHPLDPIEEAAKLMREHKIGALPVLEDEALVGIVTPTDILESLIKMTGVYGASSRLELELENRPGELAKVLAYIAEKNINVSSVMTTKSDSEGVQFVMRVNTIDARGLARELSAEGYNILWPLQVKG